MRRKNIKIRQYGINGARVNSAYIGRELKKSFVVGDSSNMVHLYSFDCEQQIETYTSNSSSNVQAEVSAVALSLNEEQIYSGSNRGIINIWSIETGKSMAPLKGHTTSINCFAVFPGEPSKLASGSYDTNIKLWDMRQKDNTLTLKGHNQPIHSLDVSPDGNLILSGSEDNTVKLWDTRGERLLMTYTEHTGSINKVRFNPEECMFASCSMDRTAKHFSCEDKQYEYISSTDVVATPITAIDYDADGKILYTAANDLLKAWNMNKSGLLLESIDSGWKGVMDIACKNNAIFGVASTAGFVTLWVCDLQQRRGGKVVEEEALVFPKIARNIKNESSGMNEILQNVNTAVTLANNLEDKRKDEGTRKKEEQEARRVEMERRRQEEQERKEREKAERAERMERERLQREAREKEEKAKRQAQKLRKMQQEQLMQIKLQEERKERERELNMNIRQTLAGGVGEQTLYEDHLDDESMSISMFMADGAQKEKLRQIELLGEIMKGSGQFDQVLLERVLHLKPLLNFWRQGKIEQALQIISRAPNSPLLLDFFGATLQNQRFRGSVTPAVAVVFLQSLGELMRNKHAMYVKSSMSLINEVVNKFKQELAKVKAFNPLTKVDLSREERLANLDRMIGEFLNIFRQERLRKYALEKNSEENEELGRIALELYRNLQEVLGKIAPKKEPEPA